MSAPVSSLSASSCLNSTVIALSQSTAAISTSVVLFMWTAPKNSVALKPEGGGRRGNAPRRSPPGDIEQILTEPPVCEGTSAMVAMSMYWLGKRKRSTQQPCATHLPGASAVGMEDWKMKSFPLHSAAWRGENNEKELKKKEHKKLTRKPSSSGTNISAVSETTIIWGWARALFTL
ncbi:hypothetical protein EYF80_018357 [Liparis tanakae]|uniref:Uncharacterized protein n=1 Tax=Liparis tanakae TaxID=230148 RepID=A0A4Z2I0I9_9TELE|nr:hypothetical protein EYF80_018357 [Liparis tanakae]